MIKKPKQKTVKESV